MEWLNIQWQDISTSSWLILLSVGGYVIGLWGYRRSVGNPLCHPLLISTPLLAAALYLSNIEFDVYYAENGLLNWLLGPTTVALAVPLARQMPQLPPLLVTVITTVILGGVFAAACALLIASRLGADDMVLLSLAAKSVTTPIAIGITQQLGGLITLMVMIVLLTGIIGIVVAQLIFHYQHIDDDRWQGLILGIAAHAIGTAKAFEKSSRCGAFATLGMGLNGIWTSIFLPSLVPFLVI